MRQMHLDWVVGAKRMLGREDGAKQASSLQIGREKIWFHLRVAFSRC